MRPRGKLQLVSVGPGLAELIPPLAETALRASEVVVGYELYLTWIKPWIDGKAVHAYALTHERERASLAIEHARNRRVVSLVSGGDIGVYGMAALVLEEMAEEDTFELSVIPGISAATSCASLLGSPLSHDFATSISFRSALPLGLDRAPGSPIGTGRLGCRTVQCSKQNSTRRRLPDPSPLPGRQSRDDLVRRRP